MIRTGRPSWRPYLAIGLISGALLLYEVGLTRLLSVVLWYHFVFLSISLAMLAIGVPGVWLALRSPRARTLPRVLLLAGIAVPTSVIGIVKARPLLLPLGFPLGWLPAALVVLMLIPMMALGAALCVLLMEARGARVGRMYGADLLGAMAGVLLVVPLMWAVPTPQLLALTGLLPLVAAILLFPEERRAAPILAAVVLGLGIWGSPFTLRYTKTYEEASPTLLERWTPLGRITVFKRPIWSREAGMPWGWGLGNRYRPKPVEQRWIEQDGSAGTPIEKAAERIGGLDHLLWDVTGLAYQVHRPAKVCVIGAGGGRDVWTALLIGARDVRAVEINPAIVEAVSKDFAEFSGDVYHRPGVTPVVQEGRSYLRQTRERFDLIQVSLVDSWAATAAGAYALSENHLYTVEAVQLYWDSLTSDGIVSLSRWSRGGQQLESARLVLLVEEALRRRGVTDPRRHLALAEAGGIGTLLVFRRPLSALLLERIDAVCRQRGFARIWPPTADAVIQTPVQIVLRHGPGALERHGLDMTPPTDDRPFFFQTVSLLGRPGAGVLDGLGFNETSVVLLRRLLAMMVAAAFVLFSLPFVLRGRLPRAAGFWPGSVYFAAIGLAFMCMEMPWIQRSILYLGHPSYATVAVLASLLSGAGLSSIVSARVTVPRIRRAAVLLPLVAAATNALLGPLMTRTLGAPAAARVLVLFLALQPPAWLMGFAFPTGMRRFGEANKPWFWAVNGAFGVAAGTLSLALAILAGFRFVGWLGVLAYLVATAVLRASGGGWEDPRPAGVESD